MKDKDEEHSVTGNSVRRKKRGMRPQFQKDFPSVTVIKTLDRHTVIST